MTRGTLTHNMYTCTHTYTSVGRYCTFHNLDIFCQIIMIVDNISILPCITVNMVNALNGYIWTIQGQSSNNVFSITLFPEAIKKIFLRRAGDAINTKYGIDNSEDVMFQPCSSCLKLKSMFLI